jgi:hypothetical protein
MALKRQKSTNGPILKKMDANVYINAMYSKTRKIRNKVTQVRKISIQECCSM